MVSQIDPTVPIFGTPTTASVRQNFLIAKDEISALQNKSPERAPVITVIGSGPIVLPANADVLILVAISPVNLTLPNGNVVDQRVTIKDSSGQAGTNHITVSAVIDGNPSYVLMSDYASLSLTWMGSTWGTI